MAVCREKGITRIYIPIWVAFNEAKYSPAFVEGLLYFMYSFSMSCRMFLGYVLDYSMFCVLIVRKDTV